MSQTGRRQGTAFVIGGSGGVGSACAIALSSKWTHVAVGYMSNRAAAESVAEQIKAAGGEAFSVRVDIRADESVQEAIASVGRLTDSLDCLVYSGGTRKAFSFISTTSHEQWMDAFEVDVFGFLRVIRASLPALRGAHGCIVATTTYQASRIEPRGALSSVPKAALERLITALAKEEGRYGVRANAVRLGWIDAGSGAHLLRDDQRRASRVRQIPMARFGAASEVANAIAFLGSADAGFTTGTIITVDGGESL